MLKSLVLVCLLAAAPARATDSAGNATAWGLAAMPCELVVTPNLNRDIAMLEDFSAGFMEAVNLEVPGSANHFPGYFDPRVFALMIRATCRENPGDTVGRAAARAVTLLMKPEK